jgi:O-succinylbenzoic acid--CoA ligase
MTSWAPFAYTLVRDNGVVIIVSGDAGAPDAAAHIRRMLADREPFAVAGAQPDERVDVVLRTSGSTGTAKSVGHTFDAVGFASRTSRSVLGDDGWRWLVLLAPSSTGGFMTVARSLQEPLVWPGAGGRFDPDAVTDWYPGGAQATSLVSTQLARLLSLRSGVTMLRSMRAVLVGGGPLPEGLRSRCTAEGIRAVATYGATETLGGCVYDGVPWPGVAVSVEEGRILIDGPNLAHTYVPGPALPRPWPTGDLGRWVDGRLQVTGRLDDQVPVKGVNRRLAEFEAEAMRRPGVVEAVAVPVPDDSDGYRVVVFVEDDEHRLPRLRSGKPDRQELDRRARGQRR